MAGLLPSKPDIDPSDEPRVVGLDSEDADDLIDALSSTTARRILATLHEEPAAASVLAKRVDTSLQNVQYHLRNLEDAGLVEVGDTVYSEKGREMKVYTPADRALVVVAGRKEETTGLRAALTRLLGGVGILGLASVVVDRLARGGIGVGMGADSGASGGSGGDTSSDGLDSGGSSGASSGGSAGSGGDAAGTTTTAEPTTAAGDGGIDVSEATTTATGPTPETAAETVTQTAQATETATAVPTAEPTATATSTPTAMPTATPTAEPTATVQLTEEAVRTTSAAAPTIVDTLAASPGLLFFLGGATVLLGGFALWWIRR